MKNGNKCAFESVTLTLAKQGNMEPLIKALEHENWELRHIATQSLGVLGDTRAVEPLIKVLEKKDGITSEAAARMSQP